MEHNLHHSNHRETPHEEAESQAWMADATRWFVGRTGQRFGFEMPADVPTSQPLGNEERLQQEQRHFRRWQDQGAARRSTFLNDDPINLEAPEPSDYQAEIDTRVAALRAEGLGDTKIKARLSRTYHPDVNPAADPKAMRYMNSQLTGWND
jgi:hypothetical protein